jgi:hypothetical protein
MPERKFTPSENKVKLIFKKNGEHFRIEAAEQETGVRPLPAPFGGLLGV